jgi:hypothetical protein
MFGAESGDTYEELLRVKGGAILAKAFGAGNPMVRLSGAAGAGAKGGLGARNTPLDFRLDHKYGGELKTLHIEAKNQRIAMKPDERDRKRLAAAKSGLTPLIVVQVVDQANGEVHVYAHTGSFESKRLHTLEHLGSYKYSQAEFRNAQKATGHWDKRLPRATAQGK